MQADLPVGEQHQRRLPARVGLHARDAVVAQRAPEQGLPGRVRGPRRQAVGERVQGGRVATRGKRLERPREHGSELAEHGEISRGDERRDVLYDIVDDVEQRIAFRLPVTAQHGVHTRERDLHRLEPSEQQAKAVRNLVLTNEPPGRPRRPRRERAPVRILWPERVRERGREVVVRLRDQEVPPHRLAVEADHPLDPLE